MDEYSVVNCPHCEGIVVIFHNELNCKIFRHRFKLHSNRIGDEINNKHLVIKNY